MHAHTKRNACDWLKHKEKSCRPTAATADTFKIQPTLDQSKFNGSIIDGDCCYVTVGNTAWNYTRALYNFRLQSQFYNDNYLS